MGGDTQGPIMSRPLNLALGVSALLCAVGMLVYFKVRGDPGKSPAAAAPAMQAERSVGASEISTSVRTAVEPERPVETVPPSSSEPRGSAAPVEEAADPEQELASQIRALDEYRSMSIEELEAERERLAKPFAALNTKLHMDLYERGLGINLGPASKVTDSSLVPPEYRDWLYAHHQTGGVDAIYITVLDPAEHPDLYKVKDTMSLLADLANEKRFPR